MLRIHLLAARTGQAECRARVSARPLGSAVQCHNRTELSYLGAMLCQKRRESGLGGTERASWGKTVLPPPTSPYTGMQGSTAIQCAVPGGG